MKITWAMMTAMITTRVQMVRASTATRLCARVHCVPHTRAILAIRLTMITCFMGACVHSFKQMLHFPAKLHRLHLCRKVTRPMEWRLQVCPPRTTHSHRYAHAYAHCQIWNAPVHATMSSCADCCAERVSTLGTNLLVPRDSERDWVLSASWQHAADEPAADDDRLESDWSDDSEDDAQPSALLLHDQRDVSKKSTTRRNKSSAGLYPRSIEELGRLSASNILSTSSTFPSGEHALLRAKELAVYLQTPKIVHALRVASGSHQFLSCSCSAKGCTFKLDAGIRKQSAKGSSATEDIEDEPMWDVKTYNVHTCYSNAPPQAGGAGDAHPKHVRASIASSVQSLRQWRCSLSALPARSIAYSCPCLLPSMCFILPLSPVC